MWWKYKYILGRQDILWVWASIPIYSYYTMYQQYLEPITDKIMQVWSFSSALHGVLSFFDDTHHIWYSDRVNNLFGLLYNRLNIFGSSFRGMSVSLLASHWYLWPDGREEACDLKKEDALLWGRLLLYWKRKICPFQPRRKIVRGREREGGKRYG